MSEPLILNYRINDTVELNLSYMPYVTGGGIFVPTPDDIPLGTKVLVNLVLPGLKDSLKIEGKVVWITPPNALYQVLPGVGVQFTGTEAQAVRGQIEAGLDKTMEIGGYTLGTPRETNEKKDS